MLLVADWAGWFELVHIVLPKYFGLAIFYLNLFCSKFYYSQILFSRVATANLKPYKLDVYDCEPSP
jgi:hypothetical protein